MRIAPDELGQLQRNIVLSHAAGVGAPMSAANVRLMMALKLASLARGASGVRPATLAFMQQMLDRGVLPVVPKQGSVGASGDLAPLAHMTAAMLGVGEAFLGGGRMPADAALARAELTPLVLGPKEGLALLNGTQFSTAEALGGCSRSSACSRRRWSPARLRPMRRKAPTRRSIRASMRCAAIAGRSRSPTRCAR